MFLSTDYYSDEEFLDQHDDYFSQQDYSTRDGSGGGSLGSSVRGAGERAGGTARTKKMTVRDAWQLITSNLGRHNYGVTPAHERSEVQHVIFTWHNPNPSVSIKHIANTVTSEDDSHFNCDVLESSCYVDGFRIVQNRSGEIFAEFCLVFAYGSRSFLNWKSYTEFNEYIKILKELHSKKPLFPQTLECWEALQAMKRWTRCLSVSYLIEKSSLLSRVAESSFLESPTPALLLEFVQHEQCHAVR